MKHSFTQVESAAVESLDESQRNGLVALPAPQSVDGIKSILRPRPPRPRVRPCHNADKPPPTSRRSCQSRAQRSNRGLESRELSGTIRAAPVVAQSISPATPAATAPEVRSS